MKILLYFEIRDNNEVFSSADKSPCVTLAVVIEDCSLQTEAMVQMVLLDVTSFNSTGLLFTFNNVT